MLVDPRIAKMAELIVRYSVAVREGDFCVIRATPVAAPLVQECYRQVLLAGGQPHAEIRLPDLDEIHLRTATDEQLNFLSPAARFLMDNADVQINILSDVNTKTLSAIPPEKIGITQKARRELLQTFLRRDNEGTLRWSIAMYPTEAYAQDAEMSVNSLADFIFDACLLNEPDPVAAWQAVAARQERIIERLKGKREVRLVGPGTDLTFSVADRIFINDDGKKNLPGGEVFTGPVEDSANGTITFSYPAVYGGKEVEGVRLRFEAGKVVEARAAKNEELLTTLLATDDGAKRLGEFAFGTNPGITRFTRNTLFDEKIGGTIHMALGSSYPASGGTNQSAIHWDMVCDLRNGGEIWVDGALFAKDGAFVE